MYQVVLSETKWSVKIDEELRKIIVSIDLDDYFNSLELDDKVSDLILVVDKKEE